MQEFKDRKMYDLGRSHLRRAGAAGSEVTVESKVERPHAQEAAAQAAEAPAVEVKPGEASELLLFTTRTCPNCKRAEAMLQKAGIAFTKVVSEESQDLVSRYDVQQAPTLVVLGGEEPVRIVGIGPVLQFIKDNQPVGAGK